MDEITFTYQCPFCGTTAASLVGVNGSAEPTAQDLSLCPVCYRVSVFDYVEGNLQARCPTQEEEAQFTERYEGLISKTRAALMESYSIEGALALVTPDDLVIRCPYCGKDNDRREEPDHPGLRPSPGDGSLCWSCQQVSVYDGDPETGVVSGLRRTTDTEKFTPKIARYLAAIFEADGPEQAVDLIRNRSDED